MLRLKNLSDRTYSAFFMCLVEDCEKEALKLWPTETNIIDVCEEHFLQLQREAL